MNIHNINNKPGPSGPQEQKIIPLTPDDVKEMLACPECFSEAFFEASKFALISALNPKNQSGKDEYVGIPVMVCAKCGSELKKD